MSPGKLPTFTRGKATSLPQQGAAPPTEAWQTETPQPQAPPKRFGGFSLTGRSASNRTAPGNGVVPDGAAVGNGAVPGASTSGYGASAGSAAPSNGAALGEGASLSSVVDTAAANSADSVARAEAPAVRLRRLAGVASWALVLVLAGVASAIVGLFRIFGDGPAWFTPAFISCGVVGMMLAMMAFATVRFRGVPWMFMAASSITLLAAFVMLRLA